ncbi:uncharacterized protein LOC125185468 [Salvia hispanica]|uniref:uncharacterized protein LOC125185468 n=1 Tax=Salvia hispanica TaxID=49212 RepID=UPI0020093B99|nr:uncharacterized protein LOC125185468 [Salvia hispanica]
MIFLSQQNSMCEKMEKGTTDITDIVFSQQNKEREEKVEEESIAGNPKEIEKTEEEKNCGDDSDKNGGVLSGLIAGILHPTQESDETETSLMDNIVSHLPAPLSDDAAPATEEASILIHAIVHD